MPTYSYACTECGHRFDVTQAFTDDALTTCEQCSGRLRKIFGSVGVVFKGSGFYRTDSRESRKSTSNGHSKADTSASSRSDTGSDSGSDSGSGSGSSGSAEKATTSPSGNGSATATPAAGSSAATASTGST